MPESVPCDLCGARLKPENEASHMRRVHPNVSFTPRFAEGTRSARPSFYLSSGMKKALFAVVAAVVLVTAGVVVALDLANSVPTDANAIPVRISMSGWDPPTLTTTVGTPLRIDVIAMDDAHGAGHDFRIDELGVNEYVGSTQKIITLPTGTAGSYVFYCSLCCGGKDSPSMVGTLRVDP